MSINQISAMRLRIGCSLVIAVWGCGRAVPEIDPRPHAVDGDWILVLSTSPDGSRADDTLSIRLKRIAHPSSLGLALAYPTHEGSFAGTAKGIAAMARWPKIAVARVSSSDSITIVLNPHNNHSNLFLTGALNSGTIAGEWAVYGYTTERGWFRMTRR